MMAEQEVKMKVEGMTCTGCEAHPKSRDYDLLIIGSGGAAFSAAIKAVEYGARVAMIERGAVGGTCVNIGCVPSKTLLRAGEINRHAAMNPFNGLQTTAGKVDLASLVAQKNELVDNMRHQKYEKLVDDYGFDMIRGEAKFVDEQTIEVGGRMITAGSFLIATGATPFIPEIPGLENVDYLTSTSALQLQEVPNRIAVIGSGYIALELGQLFHHLGSEVTLMQRSKRILKEYDPEISEAVHSFLTEQRISTVTGIRYERIEQGSRAAADCSRTPTEYGCFTIASRRRESRGARRSDCGR